MSSTPFDRQLADMVWVMTTALRAGYSLPQVFETLASEAPQPTAGACAKVAADLKAGLALDQALSNWQKAFPSTHLADVVAVLRKQGGGNLPALLEPVGEKIFAQVGSDSAFLPAMRSLAQAVGAALPKRAG